MKFSKETMALIKNYASINGNLVLKPGKKLSTIHVQQKIFSSASIVEEFPVQFPIYDVNELLAVMSLFENPDIDFSEKYLTIKEGNSSLKYFAAAMEGMKVPPEKTPNFGDAVATFNLSSTLLNTIPKTAGVLKVSDISIIGNGSTINITIADKKNATSNSYSTDVGTTSKNFRVNIAVDNIKLMPNDYEVTITQKCIVFQSKTSDLVYYVAIELDSKFE